MHTDEAVNAYIVGQLLSGGTYTYDPHDRHGPALAALALPLARIQGAKAFADLTESELRLAPVLAGTVTILLFGVATETYGFVPCLIAALFFAAGPLPLYYDRYFIHESLFVAATFGLILSLRRPLSIRCAILAGTCTALMLACKETAVLHIVALVASALCYWLWNLRGQRLAAWWRPKAIISGTSVFLILTIALFTWFGANWRGPSALLYAFPNLLARAGGEGHQKPFWYFAQLLTGGWSGGVVFALASSGLFLALRKRRPSPPAFVAFYAIFITAIYSAIPYKTPWLALNLWLPISILAGFSIESLWRLRLTRPALHVAAPAFTMLLGTALAVLIAHDTVQRVYKHPSDETNPYAYAHTSEDLLSLPDEINQLARQASIASPRIAVIAADPWPLPWYLRHFSQTGFWQPGQQPASADFYITSTDAAEQYRDQLKDFHADFFGVRPGVLILLWSPIPK